MKLKERTSWLMCSVQKSLFPHFDECFETPLTEQEKRLVTILEIVEVRSICPGRHLTNGLAARFLSGKQ